MFCPKCGNEVDLFADKCLCCQMSFKSMTLAQRQELQENSIHKRANARKNHGRNACRPSKAKQGIKATQTRIEYNNGIACKEGMSYTGRRLKKGSFKKRPNNEGIGFRLPAYGLGDYPR